MDKHGPKRWSVIAKELKVKSSKQCRRRWKNVLNAVRKTGAQRRAVSFRGFDGSAEISPTGAGRSIAVSTGV